MALKYWILIPVLGLFSCGGNTGAVPTKEKEATSLPGMAPAQTELVINGPDKVYDTQGRLEMEGDRKNGLRQGVWTSYFPNGRVKSKNEYREGKLQGLSTVFRENGSIYYTGQHKDDKQVGEWRFYDEQGTLERTVTYDIAGVVINDPG
ncbi:MAG: hypothetical protein ABIY71_10775 [Flavobacteriales bacterium]